MQLPGDRVSVCSSRARPTCPVPDLLMTFGLPQALLLHKRFELCQYQGGPSFCRLSVKSLSHPFLAASVHALLFDRVAKDTGKRLCDRNLCYPAESKLSKLLPVSALMLGCHLQSICQLEARFAFACQTPASGSAVLAASGREVFCLWPRPSILQPALRAQATSARAGAKGSTPLAVPEAGSSKLPWGARPKLQSDHEVCLASVLCCSNQACLALSHG